MTGMGSRVPALDGGVSRCNGGRKIGPHDGLGDPELPLLS